MHIYDKQCEIIQTKSMEGLKLSDSVFHKGPRGRLELLAKNKENKED